MIYRTITAIWMVIWFAIPASWAQNGPPWIKTNVGVNYILTGIDFPGNQNSTGFIAGESLTYNGNGIVLKTTDGGETWNQVWSGTNMGVEGSCFVDVNNGFIAGWPKLANGWSGFGRTNDGGMTWTSPAVAPDLYYLTDVVFKDANHGIIIGSTNTSPLVYVTSNGGNSWTAASGAGSGMPQSACYVSGNTYFLVDNNGHIKKSTDNGNSWTVVHTIPGLILTGIDFYNDNLGMASGDNGVIVKTTDGGATWQNQVVGNDIWRDFGWETQDHLFACGTPEIVAESIDGGSTWTNGFPGSTFQAALYECIFTENGKGFICGSQGTLLKRNPSCTAGFSASATSVCTGAEVEFQSQSTGNISTYEWTFEGGSPAASQVPDPVVTYAQTGSFDVQLVVNNGYWTDTLTMQDFIIVNQTTAPVITLNGVQLSSNASAGNQWYLAGAPVSGATGQSHLATQSGWYWDVVTLNGCESDTSNNIFVTITGIDNPGAGKMQVIYSERDATLTIQGKPGGSSSASLLLLDVSGRQIFHQKALAINESGPVVMSCGHLSEGIYFWVINTDVASYSGKLHVNPSSF